MNFMGTLLRVKRFTRESRLAFFIFLCLGFSFFLTLCTSPKKSAIASHAVSVSEEERTWLLGFFRDLLFENQGAYTLYGTKPVSVSLIEAPLTEEEKAEWKAYYDSLPIEERPEIIRMKKRYDFAANYQKWKEIENRFSIGQYLFGKFRLTPKAEVVVFLNIETTLKTLLKHYTDFRRVVGYDFDPLQVVFDVENEESSFWNRVIKERALSGILLGYGQDNSWFFEWNLKYEEAKNQMGDFVRSLPSEFYEKQDILYPDPQHFSLPIFRSFGLHPDDEQLFNQYKKERATIKHLYRGRDEVDVALEWLTRCAPQAHKWSARYTARG